MTRIGVRELRQHASRYLELVKSGGTVEVTERGQLVALLVPPSASQSDRDRLVTAGILVPAKSTFRLPTRQNIPARKGTPSESLDESRADRTG